MPTILFKGIFYKPSNICEVVTKMPPKTNTYMQKFASN